MTSGTTSNDLVHTVTETNNLSPQSSDTLLTSKLSFSNNLLELEVLYIHRPATCCPHYHYLMIVISARMGDELSLTPGKLVLSRHGPLLQLGLY